MPRNGLAPRNLAVEVDQVSRRLDTGVLDQEGAVLLEHPQRLGLAARLVQPPHQECTRALAVGLVEDELYGDADRVGRPPDIEQRLGAQLEHHRPPFVHPRNFGAEPHLIRKLREGPATPECFGLAEVGKGGVGVAAIEQRGPVYNQPLEGVNIGLTRLDHEAVAADRGLDPVAVLAE